MRELVVGTRGSALAMWQTNWVVDRLRELHPELRVRIENIKTEGDVKTQAPLWQIGGRGLFVREIERALVDGKIDIAVHSMKDLPSDTDPSLVVAAVPAREDPRDALVSRHRMPLAALPKGARLGTSSSRRCAQLLAFRPDLEIVPLRGNVDTRLRKSESEELDGVLLAAAGLSRLGYLDRVTEFIPLEICLPDVGQAALAVQARSSDQEVVQTLAGLDDPVARATIEAERSLMLELNGGCQLPLAALCQPLNGGLVMEGLVASLDGRKLLRVKEIGAAEGPESLGKRVAEKLRELGAEALLAEVSR